MNTGNEFYVIEYEPDGSGVPHHFDTIWNPELPDYDIFKSAPLKQDFADGYALKAKSFKLDGDFFPYENLISSEMLNLISEMNIKCINIPVEISLHRNKRPAKNYFLFFISSYLSILDENESIFSISRHLETGKLNTPSERGLDKIYYEKIDKFKIISGIKEHLFFCKEILRPVCSLSFKNRFEMLKLRGIKFEKIDDEYKYDCW